MASNERLGNAAEAAAGAAAAAAKRAAAAKSTAAAAPSRQPQPQPQATTSDLQKMVKMAVPDDRNPPGALVLTKLVEWYRFEVGHKKICFVIFVTCHTGVCEKTAAKNMISGRFPRSPLA